MDAANILEALRDDAGSVKVLENRDVQNRIRFVVLWRWEAGEFHRMVVAPNTYASWASYGEVAAKNRLQRDIGSTEVVDD